MIHGYSTRMDAELRDRPGVIQSTVYTCCGLTFLDGELRTSDDDRRRLSAKSESVTKTFTDIDCPKCKETLGREVDQRLTGRQHRDHA